MSVFVLWMILAATLDLGRGMAASHVLQTAARAATRELALTPLPADLEFDQALRESSIFDPDYLVVRADCLESQAVANSSTPEAELVALLGSRQLNQMLRPLMVFERVEVGGAEQHLLRYPGALLDTGSAPDQVEKPCTTRYTVGVPELRDAEGLIVWHAVVEEIAPGAFAAGADSSAGDRSLGPATVALRLHYPFQAVGLSFSLDRAPDTSGYRVEGSAPGAVISALDSGVDEGVPLAYAQSPTGATIPVYGGSLGLGFQAVLGRVVRPYRRIITAQAIAPREILEPPLEAPGAPSP